MTNSEISTRIRVTAKMNAVIAENLIRTTNATNTDEYGIPSYVAAELLLRASRYLAHALSSHQNDFPFEESLKAAISTMNDAKDRTNVIASRTNIQNYIMVLEEIFPHL